MSIRLLFGASLALSTLTVPSADAQDADLQAKIEQAHDRYEQAWIAGDAGALVSMFGDDAVYWPVIGGTFEGREKSARPSSRNLPPAPPKSARCGLSAWGI